ncbi:MAG: hypothetical protein MUC65_01400 [Pontiellaceae bacterium]|jgi:hypothetical protein|nr:hypothetical protein [Pontiellaceae bacterium]
MGKHRTILCLLAVLFYGTAAGIAAPFDPYLTGTVRGRYWWDDGFFPDPLFYPWYSPWDYGQSVFVEFHSIREKRQIMAVIKSLSAEDPRQIRFQKRMAEICSTNFTAGTNTFRMDMAPGLTGSH